MATIHEPLEIIDRRTGSADAIEETALITLAEVERAYADPLPIFDRILIRQGAQQTVFAGTTFVIPESARKAPNQGVVVATAESYIVEGKSFPMVELVKPGDLVTFSAFNTEEIERDGAKFVLCSIFDVKLIERVTFAIGAANAARA